MQQLIDAIDREARNLPPQAQQEVLDFINQLRRKYSKAGPPAWLEQAWGAAPDFPDRPEQPPLNEPPLNEPPLTEPPDTPSRQ